MEKLSANMPDHTGGKRDKTSGKVNLAPKRLPRSPGVKPSAPMNNKSKYRNYTKPGLPQYKNPMA